MKLVSFLRDGALSTGALLPDDLVLDFNHAAAELPAADGPLDWCDLDGAPHQAARRLVDGAESRMDELAAAGAIVPLGSVTLEAPVPRPGKVICIGLNYRDHAEESGMDIPELPLVFSKFSSCVVGPEADVVLPPGAKEVDYEAEFGVVIGRTASRVKAEDAMDHVLGYCNVNDVSARDFQFADGQWQRGKSCETFCPAGPFLATADE
ncbi:MAG: fumarylacetoacetate hydrolase family protein, partial [Planctomycetota bacterium]